VLLVGALMGIGLAMTGYVKYRTNSLSLLDTHLTMPRPPISLQPSRFPCLASRSKEEGRRRGVVLHGPDWTLDSTVDLKCFPEREVVLSVEVGRRFLRHLVADRIRIWIANKGDLVYAKIVESNGSQKLDLDALDLVTDHKCGLKSRKNCHVQSARVVPRID